MGVPVVLSTGVSFKIFVVVQHRIVPVISILGSNLLSLVVYLVCAHAVASTPLDNDAADVIWLQSGCLRGRISSYLLRLTIVVFQLSW